MKYRNLGKTGKRVGIIGLGCEFMEGKPFSEVKETIDTALDNEINIFDIFMPGTEVRETIGKALGSRRKDVMIQGHFGSTDRNKQFDISRDLPTVKRYFEELLRIYGYIDFGMMYFIDSEQDYNDVFETPFITYVEQLKRSGDIHHIGFSSHNPETAMKVIQTGVPEMMMFSINPAFDMLPTKASIFDQFMYGIDAGLFRGLDPRRAELYKLCNQKQIGITSMKTFCGSKLLFAEHSPYSEAMTTTQCIQYALDRPAVSSVLPGCNSKEEIEGIMKYLNATDEEKDYMRILSGIRNDFKGNCVYCGHCQPCPANIDVATVMKYLDIARLDKENVPSSIRSHYKSTMESSGTCIECGHCENRCPFGVPVIENLKEATRLLG